MPKTTPVTAPDIIQEKTVVTFLQRAILRYAGLGLVFLVLVSLGVSFLLAREQAATDLRESARATVQAFRDRIIDGDVRSVEPQIRQVLQLRDGESAQILKTDLSRVYESFSAAEKIQACPNVGVACFTGYLGPARILFPISFNSNGTAPFSYLYLSKNVRLNWPFLLTVFVVFTLGYCGLVIAFLRVSKVASGRLGLEIARWSERMKENPRDSRPLVRPPFAELLPLKDAIEGLNIQIQQFEKTATDKAKLLILRGIAHDLLSPVSRLQLYIATLENSIDQEQNADVLSEIKDSLRRVTTIASQVKVLKEIEATKDAESTDLISAISEELKSLRVSENIISKSISLEFKSADSTILSPFSKTELSRILSNLVQNAADASQEGSVVNIEAGTSDGTTFFSVIDHGSGIPENSKERVFDPDFTLKPGTGTGLGLAIVKYICDQRAAKIKLDSKINQGTQVTISTPTLSRGTYV